MLNVLPGWLPGASTLHGRASRRQQARGPLSPCSFCSWDMEQ